VAAGNPGRNETLMLRVGLTGGIGCGKTSVAQILRELGCVVLEADPVAHRLIEPGQPAYDEIVRAFGRQVCAPDGRIARARLAAIVFADSAKLARLNSIVHPRVARELDRELDELARAGRHDVAVVEAALLIEATYHERLDRLVVVWCDPEQQIARLLARGMTPAQVEARIAAQMQLDQKRRLADDEIDCSGSPEETRRQVKSLVAKLKQLGAAAARQQG